MDGKGLCHFRIKDRFFRKFPEWYLRANDYPIGWVIKIDQGLIGQECFLRMDQRLPVFSHGK
ncbi:hypothetical protein D3C81_1567210 [compost metagenome]